MASCSNATKEAQNKRRMAKKKLKKKNPPTVLLKNPQSLAEWKEEGCGPFFPLTLGLYKGRPVNRSSISLTRFGDVSWRAAFASGQGLRRLIS